MMGLGSLGFGAAGWAAVVIVAGLLSLLVLVYWTHRRPSIDEQVEHLVEQADDEPLTFAPPDVSPSPWGALKTWYHLSRANRLAKKGYVKWYRLGSTMSRPKWVKPTAEGAGTPKVTVSGQPHYFPKEAMVADARTGAWVAVHREGEADPLNLRDPAYPGIETDAMERIINLEAEDKPPGFLDNLDISPQMMMYLVIGLLFLLYAVYRYTNGGF